MTKEETILRKPEIGRENPFEHHVGHFYSIHETRDYMHARWAVIKELERMETHSSISAAIDHILDCLRLCRGDNMGQREFLPSLYLQVDRDQDCYDFIKWWTTTANDYDFRDMTLPFMDIHGADSLEDIIPEFEASLQFYAAYVLLKHRALSILLTMKKYDAFLLGECVVCDLH